MAEIRIATFNLENFDETAAGEWPSLVGRIMLMRPQIVRLRATIACFQEVNGKERPNQPRSLLALATDKLTSRLVIVGPVSRTDAPDVAVGIALAHT
jgi:hypothetical protein